MFHDRWEVSGIWSAKKDQSHFIGVIECAVYLMQIVLTLASLVELILVSDTRRHAFEICILRIKATELHPFSMTLT